MAVAFENIFKKFNLLMEKKNEVLMASVFK